MTLGTQSAINKLPGRNGKEISQTLDVLLLIFIFKLHFLNNSVYKNIFDRIATYKKYNICNNKKDHDPKKRSIKCQFDSKSARRLHFFYIFYNVARWFLKYEPI